MAKLTKIQVAVLNHAKSRGDLTLGCYYRINGDIKRVTARTLGCLVGRGLLTFTTERNLDVWRLPVAPIRATHAALNGALPPLDMLLMDDDELDGRLRVQGPQAPVPYIRDLREGERYVTLRECLDASVAGYEDCDDFAAETRELCFKQFTMTVNRIATEAQRLIVTHAGQLEAWHVSGHRMCSIDWLVTPGVVKLPEPCAVAAQVVSHVVSHVLAQPDNYLACMPDITILRALGIDAGIDLISARAALGWLRDGVDAPPWQIVHAVEAHDVVTWRCPKGVDWSLEALPWDRAVLRSCEGEMYTGFVDALRARAMHHASREGYSLRFDGVARVPVAPARVGPDVETDVVDTVIESGVRGISAARVVRCVVAPAHAVRAVMAHLIVQRTIALVDTLHRGPVLVSSDVVVTAKRSHDYAGEPQYKWQTPDGKARQIEKMTPYMHAVYYRLSPTERGYRALDDAKRQAKGYAIGRGYVLVFDN